MLAEEEEHGCVLSVAEVQEATAVRGRDHLAEEPDQRAGHLAEALPLPVPQRRRPATAAAARERHRGRERRAGLAARREVAAEDLDGPVGAEHDEERARQSVAAERAHRSTLPRRGDASLRSISRLCSRAFRFAIRIDSIRYANRFESIRFVKKSAFRFTNVSCSFLAYLLYSLSQKIHHNARN